MGDKVKSQAFPLYGLWQPHALGNLYYGPNCVNDHLLNTLPSDTSKAFVITGSSIATKTPLLQQVEKLLGSDRHAGSFSKIKQHAPVAELDEATKLVQADSSIDTVISIGGGSPIDSAKAISFRLSEQTGKFLTHIAIPTTLSAGECTAFAGYTNEDGVKSMAGAGNPKLAPATIFYDPGFAKYTPLRLWLGTGIRALDHAVEVMYHPYTTEVPCKIMAVYAAATLFQVLPKAKESHPNNDDVTTTLFLAAYSSLGFVGRNITGGLGLSHAMGYALGSPYGIPHGETSCLTLGHVASLKARQNPENAQQIARLLPGILGTQTGDAVADGEMVGDAINTLVKKLDLNKTLTQYGVGKDQVDIITQRATGQSEGKLYDDVKKLVESLY